MKVSYYPGCTLKTHAKNLDDAAVAAMSAIGVELVELPRWNCCGAVHSLADDDLIHQVAPVRDLIRVKEQGNDKVVTLCSMCYNTLARANLLMREDEEKRRTINLFMDEEPDYQGEVEVVHLLQFLRDQIGWDALRDEVKVPLNGLKIAPYYGCTLQRPREVGIEPPGTFQLMTELIEALGASPVDFSDADLCCGSYQILGNPEVARRAVQTIMQSARRAGAEALILSCPLCQFNLSTNREKLVQQEEIPESVPTFYFTQLLAVALGLDPKRCHFALNERAAVELLRSKHLPLNLEAAAG